jgi:alpha-L-arabinofuranosidase
VFVRWIPDSFIDSVFLLLCLVFTTSPIHSQTTEKAEVRIDLASPGHAVDRRIFGQFIEHFGRIIEGGLWAELLQNRKFYPVDAQRTQVAEPWMPEKDRSHVSYVIDRFESIDGISSQRVSLFGSGSDWRGIGQSGFGIVGEKDYVAYVWVKTDSPGNQIAFRLEAADGSGQAESELTLNGKDWQRYAVHLRAKSGTGPGVFRILFNGAGTYWIGAASLMPADNVDGMRPDVLALIQEMSPPIIRWPGGGYPDDYDWRRGIGPRDRRPPQFILPFGRPLGYDNGIDANDFGTDEFLTFCKDIAAKPYITANFGSGTPEMAADWVEYTNGKATSPFGKKRAENGHLEAYDVKDWSVGNEVWGDPFESGHTNAQGYAYFFAPISKAMRAVDPTISITAVGLLGNANIEETNWNEIVLKSAGPLINFLSIHHYYPSGFRPEEFRGKDRDFDLSVVGEPWIFGASLRELLGQMDGITGDSAKIRIALDEWSEWDWDYSVPSDTSKRSFKNQFIDLIGQTGLELNHTARDALFDARMLNLLMRMSDRVPIGIRTHMINSLGAIRTDSSRSFLTASGVVMQLYSNHSGSEFVPLEQNAPNFDVPELKWTDVPYLDAVATRTDKHLYIHLVNVHPTNAMDVHLKVRGEKIRPEGVLWQIAPANFNSRNDFDRKEVRLERGTSSSFGADMTQHVPAHSVVTLEAEIE